MTDDANEKLREKAGVAAARIAAREAAQLRDALAATSDIVLPLLKFHLFAEHMLERIIGERLPRADRVLDQRFNFAQKLALVHSFDVVPEASVQALRQVNALRNKCSHVRSKQIGAEDLDRIGQSLGSEYREIRRRHGDDPRALLIYTLGHVAQAFLAVVITPEVHAEVLELAKAKPGDQGGDPQPGGAA